MSIDRWNAAVDTKRHERNMSRLIVRRPPAPRLPGSLHPFKRASQLFTAIVECRAKYQNNLFELQQELAKFPPYVSRGHGWRGHIRNRTILGAWNQDRSKYQPHVGKKELDKAAYRALPLRQREVADKLSRQILTEDQYRDELERGL